MKSKGSISLRPKLRFWSLYGKTIKRRISRTGIFAAIIVLLLYMFIGNHTEVLLATGGCGLRIIAFVWLCDYITFLRHQLYVPLDEDEIRSLQIETSGQYLTFLYLYLRGFKPRDEIYQELNNMLIEWDYKNENGNIITMQHYDNYCCYLLRYQLLPWIIYFGMALFDGVFRFFTENYAKAFFFTSVSWILIVFLSFLVIFLKDAKEL